MYKKEIAYQITVETFNAMLADRTEAEKKENPYVYVMKVLNSDRGLLGVVKNLSIV